jgi:hypothetical protein
MHRHVVHRLLLSAITALVSAGAVSAAPYVWEDGEGSSAALNTSYSNPFTPADEKRVAQLVTENPAISPAAGSGAAKFVFSVDTGPFYSVFQKNLTANLGDYQTGALKFSFYWTGYDGSLDGRAAGNTLDQLTFLMGNASTEFGFRLNCSSLGTENILNANAWNTVVMDLPDDQNIGYPRFRNFTANTINGQAVPAADMTELLSGDASLAGLQAVWTNPTYLQLQTSHSGQGGNPSASEGFFGIDDAQFVAVPEPSSAALVLLASGLVMRRKQRP